MNLKKIFFVSMIAFLSFKCDINREITLKRWLAEKEMMKDFDSQQNKSCDSLAVLIQNFKIDEFKNRFYLDLSRCYLNYGKKKEAREYLLKSIAAGRHISWIDSSAFAPIYSKVKRKYRSLHHKFWSKKDTSYFQDIERMVVLDQALVGQTEKRNHVFKKHTAYLLDYCANNGFPWSPTGIFYFKKEKLRSGIDPTILAIHAPIKDKIILREYAIKSAEKGKNSWMVPIGIGVTFFTQLPRNGAMPIRFLYFNQNEKLQLEDSYLQLYCITKLMQWNNVSKIRICPSIANSLKQETIKTQLNQVKKAFIEEFNIPSSSIIISLKSDSNEVDRQQHGKYNYTFTNIF